MTRTSQWTLVAEYAAGFEADLATSLLEAEGIPVIRSGPEIGIFGPGFAGATTRGVSLFVPADEVQAARAVLQAPKA